MRLKKEKRPVFTKVADRPDAEDRADRRILNSDNHRSDSFGGYVHDVKQIITADELWAELQKQIAARSKPLRVPMRDFLDYQEPFEPRMFLSRGISEMFSQNAMGGSSVLETPPAPYKLPDDYGRSSIIDAFNKVHDLTFGDLPELNFSDFYDLSKTVEEAKALLGQAEEHLEEDCKKREAWEEERAFLQTASWRNKIAAQPSKEWVETQNDLPPSMLDEDELGSFDEWMDFMPSSTQFLLIGDTNHDNKSVQDWRKGGSFLQKLKEKGFTDLVLERPISFNGVYERIHSGDAAALNAPELKGWKDEKLLADAQALGIRVHAYDRQLVEGHVTKERYKELLKDRHRNEIVLAEDIQNAVGDRKTAIIYGCSHFAYENGLADRLGMENCRVMNVHQNLEDYREPKARMNATYPAPYVYLVEEETVVAARGDYQRQVSPSRDKYLSKVVLPTEEEFEIERFSARFELEKDGMCADDVKSITAEQIVQAVRNNRLNEDMDRMRKSLLGMFGRFGMNGPT